MRNDPQPTFRQPTSQRFQVLRLLGQKVAGPMRLGPAMCPLSQFLFWLGGFKPIQIDVLKKVGTLILSSLLEDLGEDGLSACCRPKSCITFVSGSLADLWTCNFLIDTFSGFSEVDPQKVKRLLAESGQQPSFHPRPWAPEPGRLKRRALRLSFCEGGDEAFLG